MPHQGSAEADASVSNGVDGLEASPICRVFFRDVLRATPSLKVPGRLGLRGPRGPGQQCNEGWLFDRHASLS